MRNLLFSERKEKQVSRAKNKALEMTSVFLMFGLRIGLKLRYAELVGAFHVQCVNLLSGERKEKQVSRAKNKALEMTNCFLILGLTSELRLSG